MCSFNSFLLKNQRNNCFMTIDKVVLKFVNMYRILYNQNSMKKNSQVGGLRATKFQDLMCSYSS